MDLKELFDLHEKLETRVNAYWTYWSVVVLAVCGWVLGAKGLSPIYSKPIALGLSMFFLGNLLVLWPATKLVIGVRDEIRFKSKDDAALSPQFALVLGSQTLRHRLAGTIAMH